MRTTTRVRGAERALDGRGRPGAALRTRGTSLDDAIRAIPAAWFKPDPRVYWTDMLSAAAIGWAAFAAAIFTRGWTRGVFLIVAALALYHAVLFIHELTHLAPRDVPGFRITWNSLVGMPLLLPSFLYEGVHTDHHRQRTYSTAHDPEYLPFGHRSPRVIASYYAGSLLTPLALAIRFAILAPLSWVVPPLRRVVVGRMSALIINHQYVRHAPITRAALVQEIGATFTVWSAIALWWAGVAPPALFGVWLAVTMTASAVNAIRTLASHRYDHEPQEAQLSMVEQLLDSCTIAPSGGLRGGLGTAWRNLWAPVGLRYHALHHWIPSLPYHNLGRVHRLLVSRLALDAPYTATQYAAIAPVVLDLVRRASRHRVDIP